MNILGFQQLVQPENILCFFDFAYLFPPFIGNISARIDFDLAIQNIVRTKSAQRLFDRHILARHFHIFKQVAVSDLNHHKRVGIIDIRRKCCSVENFLERNILVNEELSVFRVDPRAGFQQLHALGDEPLTIGIFGFGETSANVEHMDQSDALKVVRVLNQGVACEVVRKVDNFFQSVTDFRLIA